MSHTPKMTLQGMKQRAIKQLQSLKMATKNFTDQWILIKFPNFYLYIKGMSKQLKNTWANLKAILKHLSQLGFNHFFKYFGSVFWHQTRRNNFFQFTNFPFESISCSGIHFPFTFSFKNFNWKNLNKIFIRSKSNL